MDSVELKSTEATAPSRSLPAAPVRRRVSTLLESGFGAHRIVLDLTVPELPGGRADFACHSFRPGRGRSLIVALWDNKIHYSRDGGDSWGTSEEAMASGLRFMRAFVRHEGGVLVQAESAAQGTGPAEGAERAPILVFDDQFRLLARNSPGLNQWHGSTGIDQSGGTIIYGEYPANPRRVVPGVVQQCDDCCLFRSVDGGLSWNKVLEVSGRDIRHFHTVTADPFVPRQWWASSGDLVHECHVWRSSDDGLTWQLASREFSAKAASASAVRSQSLFRFTDLVITDDSLLWGVDDWLGSSSLRNSSETLVIDRAGSRICKAEKNDQLYPEVIGYVGNPVRSVVDLGIAWLFLTEAKHLPLSRPQMILVSKNEPHVVQQIGDIDVFGSSTGFTYSRCSRIAEGGRFFTFRKPTDVFQRGARILQWDVYFQ